MRVVRTIERYIDRQLARDNYVGTQSMALVALGAGPLIFVARLDQFIEPYSNSLFIVALIMAVGWLILFQVWIGMRRAAGMGYFSTRRSERYLGRMRRLREKRRAENVSKPGAQGNTE